jgi:hypothetical protein
MGLFDSLLKSVSNYIPDEYEDDVAAAAQEYAPQAKELGSSALSSIGSSLSGLFNSNPTNGRMSDEDYAKWKAAGNDDSKPGFWENLFTDDPNSGWYDTMNQVPDNEKYTTRAELEAAKLANANKAKSPGIMDSIKNYFTDDPNSGWYDEMTNNNALRSGEADYDAYLKNLRSGEAAYASNPTNSNMLESAYKTALSGIGKAAPTLGALAPVLGSGLGYLASSGLRDQSQSAYNNSLNSAGTQVSMGPSASENLQDSQQDLANRATATQMIAQRANMGLTDEDKAMFEKARQQADEGFQANQSKITTDLNRRGMGLSPALVMAQQQQAAQDNAKRQNDAQLAQTAESFKAKQAAATALGTMANANLQGDFSRGLAKANNQDAISRFNAEQERARANALTQAQQTQGNQLGNAAADKAGAITNIGSGIGTAIGALLKK